MFDLAACVVDERLGPPPVVTELARVDEAARARLAKQVVATLPKGTTVELDVGGMAHVVTLDLPGGRSAPQVAPEVLAFVRAHACLFGVTDPKRLDAHVIAGGRGTWVLFDVKPRSVGVIQADVENWGKHTRVKIEGHLWPIADTAPAGIANRKKLLARYLGLKVIVETGLDYMVDPKTHEHTGCVPEYSEQVTSVSTFRVRPGPMLACRASVLAVVAGAFVSHEPMKRGHDAVLDELPGALDLAGNRITPYLAPPTRAPDDEDLAFDALDCTP